MPKKMSKGERINITDLAMDWAIIEPRKRYKTATDYAYYLEKDFRRCYEQGKKDTTGCEYFLPNADCEMLIEYQKTITNLIREVKEAKEQGRKEERELNLSRINNIWSWFQFNESPECVDIRRDIFEFKEYLEQELKKLRNGR